MVNMQIKKMYAQLAMINVLNVVEILNAQFVLITTIWKKVLVLLPVKLDSMVIKINSYVLNVML